MQQYKEWMKGTWFVQHLRIQWCPEGHHRLLQAGQSGTRQGHGKTHSSVWWKKLADTLAFTHIKLYLQLHWKVVISSPVHIEHPQTKSWSDEFPQFFGGDYQPVFVHWERDGCYSVRRLTRSVQAEAWDGASLFQTLDDLGWFGMIQRKLFHFLNMCMLKLYSLYIYTSFAYDRI